MLNMLMRKFGFTRITCLSIAHEMNRESIPTGLHVPELQTGARDIR